MTIATDETRITAPGTISAMTDAAEAFLASLDPPARQQAVFPFDADERGNWHYIPKARNGLARRDMNGSQLEAAEALIRASASESGAKKVLAIMENEAVLGEIEATVGELWHDRDPGLYFFTVFGDPAQGGPWGWRVEGHHVSLNYSVFGDQLLAVTPSFLGCNRAEVLHGPHAGQRILPDEEELGRQLLLSLDREQLCRATIYPVAPREFFTRASRRVEIAARLGLHASEMTADQRERLVKLIQVYTDRKPADVARVAMRKIEREGLDSIAFGWAGSSFRFQPHYYRLHGPAFFAEYDNTQDNANHIHSVWRDVEGDFGTDLLAEHYAESHRPDR